jgi:exosome complex RNA-binding protein Rrp4
MNTLEKIMGTKGCFLVIGATETDMPEGYAAYSLIVAVDSTIIASVVEFKDGGPVELTTASWEGVELKRGDIITLEYPVVTITLTAATDSVFCYLEDTTYVAEE